MTASSVRSDEGSALGYAANGIGGDSAYRCDQLEETNQHIRDPSHDGASMVTPLGSAKQIVR
jgi:hypothetical protein